jgi:hypothetical protein
MSDMVVVRYRDTKEGMEIISRRKTMTKVLATTLNVVLLFAVFTTFTCAIFAQGNAATYHVFPQIADGTFPDGSSYSSVLFATNTSAVSANCTYRLYGLSGDRVAAPSPFDPFALPAFGGFTIRGTKGTASFASGYATLSCEQPVAASVLYLFGSTSGILGLATVFSAPRSLVAQYTVPNTNTGFRLGLAIANDTDLDEQYLVILSTSDGAEVGRINLTIQARSTIARFVNELFTVPPTGFFGSVAIISAKTLSGASGGEFRTVGLLFLGSTFSTMPPTVLRFAQ